VEPAGQPPLQAPVAEPGLLEHAGLLWAELRGLAHDQFELVALELRQACSRFALMVALALVAAALCATAWLGLAAAAVFWLIERGASPVDALLAAVGANLAVAALCVLLLRRESREMPFAATLRSFLSR
jgi:branched-subunit amino acid ABC-type transport system permease component